MGSFAVVDAGAGAGGAASLAFGFGVVWGDGLLVDPHAARARLVTSATTTAGMSRAMIMGFECEV